LKTEYHTVPVHKRSLLHSASREYTEKDVSSLLNRHVSSKYVMSCLLAG
jgi:hypothetical protein